MKHQRHKQYRNCMRATAILQNSMRLRNILGQKFFALKASNFKYVRCTIFVFALSAVGKRG